MDESEEEDQQQATAADAYINDEESDEEVEINNQQLMALDGSVTRQLFLYLLTGP